LISTAPPLSKPITSRPHDADLLRYANLTGRIRYRLPLALKHLYLAQFRYDLFWFISLACHLLILT
jgi:hypothetical protein